MVNDISTPYLVFKYSTLPASQLTKYKYQQIPSKGNYTVV